MDLGEFMESCPDCAVPVDFEHLAGCGVAQCLVTGLRRRDCQGRHGCGEARWSGRRPGWMECAEFGWLQDAGFPDLNRLYRAAVWNRETCRWLKQDERLGE